MLAEQDIADARQNLHKVIKEDMWRGQLKLDQLQTRQKQNPKIRYSGSKPARKP